MPSFCPTFREARTEIHLSPSDFLHSPPLGSEPFNSLRLFTLGVEISCCSGAPLEEERGVQRGEEKPPSP